MYVYVHCYVYTHGLIDNEFCKTVASYMACIMQLGNKPMF